MTVQDFINIYHTEMQEWPTAYLAYCEAESRHLNVYGVRKFANYNAFKSEKSRYLRRVRTEELMIKQKEVFLKIVKEYVPNEDKNKVLVLWENILK